MIRLVAIDLDGTLLHDDMTISPYSQEIISRVTEKGIRVVVATGRMWHSAKAKVDELDLPNMPVICYTGSWIKMSKTGESLLEEGLDTEICEKVLALGRKENWNITSFCEDDIYMDRPNGTEIKYKKYRAKEPIFIGEAFYHPTKPQTRIVLSEENEKVREEMRQKLENEFGNLVDIVHPGDDFLDIHKKGVSKATAISFLCQKWNIQKEEIIAFGNTENDVPLLKFAGISYAVANAEPIAKEAATYVCLSNEEDGVAKILETLLQSKMSESPDKFPPAFLFL